MWPRGRVASVLFCALRHRLWVDGHRARKEHAAFGVVDAASWPRAAAFLLNPRARRSFYDLAWIVFSTIFVQKFKLKAPLVVRPKV
jgi:hypothetical protein